MISGTLVVAIVLIVAAIAVVVAWLLARREREPSAADLRELERHMEEAHVHRLRPEEREKLVARWHELEANFAGDPKGTVRKADELITQTMRAEDYRSGTFEEQARNLWIDHPSAVRGYREAHEIALREGPSANNIEDLRRALFYYRAVFEELLEVQHVD